MEHVEYVYTVRMTDEAVQSTSSASIPGYSRSRPTATRTRFRRTPLRRGFALRPTIDRRLEHEALVPRGDGDRVFHAVRRRRVRRLLEHRRHRAAPETDRSRADAVRRGGGQRVVPRASDLRRGCRGSRPRDLRTRDRVDYRAADRRLTRSVGRHNTGPVAGSRRVLTVCALFAARSARGRIHRIEAIDLGPLPLQ